LICPNCGTANPDTNRFCRACGVPLQPAVAPAPAAPTPQVRGAIAFVRDALLAVVLPLPFLFPVPLFLRHRDVSRGLRLAVVLVALFWAAAVAISVSERLRGSAPPLSPAEVTCRHKLGRLARSLREYRRARGALPARLEDLVAAGLLDRRVFARPDRKQCEVYYGLPLSQIWPQARPVGGLCGIYYRPQFDPQWSGKNGGDEWVVLCDRVFGPGVCAEGVRATAATSCPPSGQTFLLVVRVNGKVERIQERMVSE